MKAKVEKLSNIARFNHGTRVYAKVRGRWRLCRVISFTPGRVGLWLGDDGRDRFGIKDRVTVRPLRGSKSYELIADRRFVQFGPPTVQLAMSFEDPDE